MNQRAFLNWLANRMVYQYGEHPRADFVLRLREIASRAPETTAPPTATPPHTPEEWQRELEQRQMAADLAGLELVQSR